MLTITYGVIFKPNAAPRATHDTMLRDACQRLIGRGLARRAEHVALFPEGSSPQLAGMFRVEVDTAERAAVLTELRELPLVRAAYVIEARK